METEKATSDMETKDISFIGNDPGAVRHGNFINYYSFNPPQQRMENFNPSMFPKTSSGPLVALDVGCNSGELTRQLHLYLKKLYPNDEYHILALDIDPLLIERAQAYSCDQITFLYGDITKTDTQDYMKKFLEMHGKKKFDIAFCFSVAMWIHLNGGDDGLASFLENIKSISRTIVMELQPWPCYRNAQRRLKKKGYDFPLYHKIRIRSEVTLYIENKISSGRFKMVYESPESHWHRKIQTFVESDE